MAMMAILDSLDGIDEALKTHYTQKDGKFHLDVTPTGGMSLEDVSGLRSALEKERGQAQQNAQQLQRFAGIDPEQAKADRLKVEEMANFNPEQQVKAGMEQREKALQEQFAKENEGKDKKITSLTSQLEKNMIEVSATKAILDAGGSIALLLGNVKSHTRLRNTDGNYIVEVIDEAGLVRVGDSAGTAMTILQYVEELKGKDDFAPAFTGSGASGSQGAGAGDSGGATKPGDKTVLPGTVHESDKEGMRENFEKIASGEVKVIRGE